METPPVLRGSPSGTEKPYFEGKLGGAKVLDNGFF